MAQNRNTSAKLPRPKQSVTRKELHLYPSFPPQFCTSTFLSIISGLESRLWSACQVKRYERTEIKVMTANAAIVHPAYLSKVDFLSSDNLFQNEVFFFLEFLSDFFFNAITFSVSCSSFRSSDADYSFSWTD